MRTQTRFGEARNGRKPLSRAGTNPAIPSIGCSISIQTHSIEYQVVP